MSPYCCVQGTLIMAYVFPLHRCTIFIAEMIGLPCSDTFRLYKVVFNKFLFLLAPNGSFTMCLK